jgi:hypothetical protein
VLLGYAVRDGMVDQQEPVVVAAELYSIKAWIGHIGFRGSAGCAQGAARADVNLLSYGLEDVVRELTGVGRRQILL